MASGFDISDDSDTIAQGGRLGFEGNFAFDNTANFGDFQVAGVGEGSSGSLSDNDALSGVLKYVVVGAIAFAGYQLFKKYK